MKVVAMFLPQFHEVKENDEWWGKGFTDWVSTRNASPLYEGHYQPHVPLNNNYYNLLEASTLRWQSELMREYSIDGLCFYHYYFEKGRKILHKPAEILLENRDINMPFCFCWANESWARSWSGLKDANAWNEVGEHEQGSDGMLLRQAYGNEKDWVDHFEYLLPFFKDDRYMKIQNKPIFVIYKTGLIDCLKEMMDCWTSLAKKEGFSGIYVIGNTPTNVQLKSIDAELFHEPVRSSVVFTENQFANKEKYVSYDALWKQILNDKPDCKRKVYYGGFVSYDDTPRRGKKGMVVTDATPEKFKQYISSLMSKNSEAENEITFINAWNEWGEGMHLEPDMRFQFDFLRAIKDAKNEFSHVKRYYERDDEYVNFLKARSDKFEMYLNDIDMWMSLREKKIYISDYLKGNDYCRIGVYGYGIMGRHLLEEIGEEYYSCIIDKQKDKIKCTKDVFLPDELPDLDIIIVASYYFYNEICEELGDKKEIISLGDIIHKLWSEI